MTDPQVEAVPQPGRLRWYQFRLSELLIGSALFAVFLGVARMLDSRLAFLLAAWIVAIVLFAIRGRRGFDAPRTRWVLASLVSVAAVYGPFAIACANTWLFDGTNTWMKVDLWKLVPVAPGGMVLELAALAIWHRHPGVPEVVLYVLSGLLTALALAGTPWIVVKARRARWVLLPLVAAVFGFCALALDAMMRA